MLWLCQPSAGRFDPEKKHLVHFCQISSAQGGQEGWCAGSAGSVEVSLAMSGSLIIDTYSWLLIVPNKTADSCWRSPCLPLFLYGDSQEYMQGSSDEFQLHFHPSIHSHADLIRTVWLTVANPVATFSSHWSGCFGCLDLPGIFQRVCIRKCT